MKAETLDEKVDGSDELLVIRHVSGEKARLGLWWHDVPDLDGQKLGCLGAFHACDQESCYTILEAACTRLREVGCSMAVGPMNGNTWRHHRFMTRAVDHPQFCLEPWNPVEWPAWWQRSGFTVLSRYSSSRLLLGERPAGLEKVRQRLDKAGVVIRELRPEQFDDDLRAIHAVSLNSFSSNFLYTPLGANEFVAMYAKVREWLHPGFVWLAELDGQVVGFVFSMPDVLAMQRGEKPDLIVKTLAVLPERRLAGLGNLLVDLSHEAAIKAGFTHALHVMQHETNTSHRITGRFGGSKIREYALYSKLL